MTKTIFVVLSSFCLLCVLSGTSFSAAHKVKSGDNLYTIAKKHHVSVDKLKQMNHLQGNSLKLGQKIVTGEERKGRTKGSVKGRKGRGAPEPVIEGVETDGDFVEYKVKRGDTIDKLAARFGVEKDDLVASNSSLGRRLSPGRVLLIPKLEEAEEGEEIVELPVKSLNLKPWKTSEEKYMLVKVAKSFMGAPYRYGGESVRGLDCSAFVKKVYDIFDVQLPRSARDQFKVGPKIAKEELSVGDLVFFRTKRFAKYPTHVGIYIGEGNFIHSSSGHGRIGVKVDSLQSDFYSRTFTGATRVKKTAEENSELTNYPDTPRNQNHSS